MSFYLDDYPDDDHQTSTQTCPNCNSTAFYNDPITGTLTCSSCYIQSQTDTQEELDYDEGVGLAATGGGKRTSTLKRGRSGVGGYLGSVGRPLHEYDRSKQLPDAESCCLAFQWLLWDASKCVSKLAGIQETSSSNNNGYDFDEDRDEKPSIMERTVEKIWFAYLNVWTEATKEYSAKYPEMRVSFRDYFLEDIRKSHLMRHLSVTVGKKVEEEILEEMQRKHCEKQYLSDEEDEKTISSTESGSTSFTGGNETIEDADSKSTTKSKKRKRQPFLTIAQLCKHILPAKPKRYPNGIYQLHPHQAALKVQPSLTLLLSILQLALTHLQTGVAPHHLTMWVSNGQLPHALNGYALLPSDLKERVDMVKKFFTRSFVPPAGAVADLSNMLATSCSWFGDGISESEQSTNIAGFGLSASLKEVVMQKANASLLNSDASHASEMVGVSSQRSSAANSTASNNADMTGKTISHHQKSLYNVPLLAARMVQDLGFDQTVLDNTMALMGVSNVPQSAALNQGSDSDSDSDNYSASRNATVDQSKKNPSLPSLKCASRDELCTPLHVAAVIVVACKFCPGWESWKIANLHATSNSDPKNQSQPAFVPWNESQLGLVGNGPTLNHYLDFLEETAFAGLEPSTGVTQFFQSLERDTNAQTSSEKNVSSTKPTPNGAKVTPNLILSGAPNPNDPSTVSNTVSSPPAQAQYHKANNIGRYTSYKYRMHKNKEVLGLEPYHPHYCRLLEYICYTIEETNTGKLHHLVEEFEKEFLMPHDNHANKTNLQRRKKRKANQQTGPKQGKKALEK